VVRLAARHGLGEQRPRARESGAPASSGASDRRRIQGLGRALRLLFEDAGGAFVKFGQFLSTRPDLVPVEITTELSHLQDDVPPEARERIDEVLQSELGAPPNRVFRQFDPSPVAAASIAQVHKAQLVSGETVAVKVQRPRVRAIVERDLDIANRLAGAAEARIDWARDIGTADLTEGLSIALMEELDFRVEARNIAGARKALEEGSVVRIPTVYESLSSDKVLVLEWMEGVPLRSAADVIAEQGLDRAEMARGLLRVLLRQIMIGGVFHADPHPGNVLVRSDGSLALIDFGSVGRLDAVQKSALARVVMAVGNKDPRQLRDALLDVVSTPTATDEDLLERALGQFLVQRLGDGMRPDAGLFRDLFSLLLDFKLTFPPSIGGVFRALVTLDGTLNLIIPGFNMVTEATRQAQDWMGELVVPAEISDTLAAEALSLLPVLRRLPRRIDRVAGAAEKGTFSVNVRLLADERDTRVINRLVNRALLTVIAAALGLISTLLLDTSAGPQLTPSLGLMEALGFLGLGVSTILFLRAFVAIMQADR